MDKLNNLLNNLSNINLGKFNNIYKCYVIGDIHGDINKFFLFLKSINIIKSTNISQTFDAYKVSTEEMRNSVREFIEFEDFSNLKNVCIVQLGDIIDGHNTCFNNTPGFINNDIMIYVVIEEIIERFKKCDNCHFILISGNHDIENIFDVYGIENKVEGAICNMSNKYSYWAQYILNSDEVYADNKNEIVYRKLVKRKDFLQNDFDIFNVMYFIVSINDETVFSHTVFYKAVLKKLAKVKGLDIEDEYLIEFLNKLFKYCVNEMSKNAKGEKINKEVVYSVIDKLFKMVSTRSYDNGILKHEKGVIYHKGMKHYFVGHEVQNEFKKIKHNMFNFYIYYIDIGLSKSLYDKNTLTNYYYIVIDYGKGVSIHRCSDKGCVDF